MARRDAKKDAAMTRLIAASQALPTRRNGGRRSGGLRYAIGALVFLGVVVGLFLIAGFRL